MEQSPDIPLETSSPDPWYARPRVTYLFPFALALLLVISAASFLIHERAIADGFGFPVDAGWVDAVVGRSLLRGEIGIGLPSESPAYAVVLGIVDYLSFHDQGHVVFVAKLLSLLALSLTGWSVFRLSRHLTDDSLIAGIAAILLTAISPALIWTGVSGLGLAWGTAFIALGLLDCYSDRPVRGTVLLGIAMWFTPTAIPILGVALIEVDGKRAIRAVAAACALGILIAWRVGTGAGMPGLPTPGQWWSWVVNWAALIGITWRSALHPAILAVAAVVGVWHLGRRALPLGLIVIVPPVVMPLIEAHPGALGRLLFPMLPAIVVLAAVGFHAIAERPSHGALRGARLALALLIAYVAMTGPAFLKARTLYAWQVENTVQAGRGAGEWIRSEDRSASTVATTAPGAVGYFSDHPVIDLNRMPDYADLLLAERPRWVAVHLRVSVPPVLRSDYEVAHTVTFRVQSGVYPSGPLVVFRRNFSGGMARVGASANVESLR